MQQKSDKNLKATFLVEFVDLSDLILSVLADLMVDSLILQTGLNQTKDKITEIRKILYQNWNNDINIHDTNLNE